jgi:hypothetical protein
MMLSNRSCAGGPAKLRGAPLGQSPGEVNARRFNHGAWIDAGIFRAKTPRREEAPRAAKPIARAFDGKAGLPPSAISPWHLSALA